jgi:hypothetical protein
VIRKRGGSLQVQVFAGRDPLTGRKRWVSRQVPRQTKAAYREAKKVEAELLEQVDQGERRDSRSRTVGELVERWLEWRQQVRPISPVTVASYRGAIDRYIIPTLVRAKVHEVDAATIDTMYPRVRAHGGKCRHCWKRDRKGEPPLRACVRCRPRPGGDEEVHEPDCARGWPVSASAVREVHSVLSGAFKQAVVWGWTAHNPARLATPPAAGGLRCRHWSPGGGATAHRGDRAGFRAGPVPASGRGPRRPARRADRLEVARRRPRPRRGADRQRRGPSCRPAADRQGHQDPRQAPCRPRRQHGRAVASAPGAAG